MIYHNVKYNVVVDKGCMHRAVEESDKTAIAILLKRYSVCLPDVPATYAAETLAVWWQEFI